MAPYCQYQQTNISILFTGFYKNESTDVFQTVTAAGLCLRLFKAVGETQTVQIKLFSTNFKHISANLCNIFHKSDMPNQHCRILSLAQLLALTQSVAERRRHTANGSTKELNSSDESGTVPARWKKKKTHIWLKMFSNPYLYKIYKV